MADNDNKNESVNDVDHNLEQVIILEEERTRRGKEVVAVLAKSEEIWAIFSKKQDILHRLYREQKAASDNFTAMNYMKMIFYGIVTGNVDVFHRIKEIDEEAKLLLTLLEDFEKKLERPGQIVSDFVRDMRAHLAKLRKELDTVANAKVLEDMADVNVPNLEWSEPMPDPEIEELADHWDQMRLKPRTTKILNEFMRVIHSNL